MRPPSAKIVGLKRKAAGPHLGGQNDAYFEQKLSALNAKSLAHIWVSKTSPEEAASIKDEHEISSVKIALLSSLETAVQINLRSPRCWRPRPTTPLERPPRTQEWPMPYAEGLRARFPFGGL